MPNGLPRDGIGDGMATAGESNEVVVSEQGDCAVRCAGCDVVDGGELLHRQRGAPGGTDPVLIAVRRLTATAWYGLTGRGWVRCSVLGGGS